MGRRDYRRREPKKAKKSPGKTSTTSILPTPLTVETIKRGKKEQREEE
jgi:hypothetical protein